MRSPDGELIVTQIHHGVLGPEGGQDERSLLAQGSAAVETVDQVLTLREAPRLGSRGRRDRLDPGAFAPREGHRIPCRVFERGGGDDARLLYGAGIAAEEVYDDWPARRARDVQDPAGHGGSGWLGDEDDDARAGVDGEPI